MTTSDKNSRVISLDKVQNGSPYKIPQPEPLYSVRPRYFNDKTTRGSRATFRLKTRGIRATPDSGSASQALATRVRDKLMSNEGYAGFLLQGMQMGFNEKSQVIQTMGDAETVYYFGRTPTTVSFNGTLIDDLDNDWFVRFVTGYNSFLRGTQLAKNFELAEMSMHNATFEGTLMNLQIMQNAQSDAQINFTCTMLIRRFEFHSSYQYGAELADDIEYTTLDNATGGILIDAQPTYTAEEIARLKLYSRYSDEQIRIIENGGSVPERTGSIAAAGIYAREIATAFNETLGGIADTLEKLSDNINKFAGALNDVVSDILNPINAIIGTVSDISDAAFAVVRAIENTVDSVLDPITVVVNNAANTERQLKNLEGTITSLPETLSEKVSRFLRGGAMSNPAFLLSPSAGINGSDAVATLKSTNIRTPRSAGSVGPSGSSDPRLSSGVSTSTADQGASL